MNFPDIKKANKFHLQSSGLTAQEESKIDRRGRFATYPGKKKNFSLRKRRNKKQNCSQINRVCKW
jgi:hypothetical protein